MIITDVTYSKKWWKTYTYVTKNHFYNPVKQSLAHSIAIKSLLSEWSALKVVPIVVFTGTAVLRDVSSNYHVVYDLSGICPKCGGNLVMRTGKYGTFYGCSNYPKCKFTTH